MSLSLRRRLMALEAKAHVPAQAGAAIARKKAHAEILEALALALGGAIDEARIAAMGGRFASGSAAAEDEAIVASLPAEALEAIGMDGRGYIGLLMGLFAVL